ncbi:ADP-ribosylglycohydrolase [Azospirillum baldaniorum]|uniref:ADP-ribosylglycohydrolase family protein n=1 Tax=Azospirillum baldaniorum TaxID=1064539 RepID=UPI0011ABCBAA|nr:ADP-ribosylglycohydrolase family protein [Azospirillum baldaniorum]TWA69754.1 ADP-ribosylglycohydrolase [Azospirillum baldaniorum]
MPQGRSERTVNSALWAAWGDALGFITELTDASGLAYRTGGHRHIDTLIAWRRKLGGRFGTVTPIPAGMYSDDTQLRLATSRAIRADGGFDVFAFSKLELPIWPLYELGGGRGSKTAADNLAKRDKNWNGNFFTGYDATGGNGAAMRIQPHVWAARDPLDFELIYAPVIRNAVCTHGHPRGILGAAFHASTLASALVHGSLSIHDISRSIDSLQKVPEVVAADRDLGRLWLPFWENKTNSSFQKQCLSAQSELFHYLEELERISHTEPTHLYSEAVRRLSLDDPARRGSGTLTAVVAAWLAIRAPDLKAALITCANSLGTDTDSIATMVGAIAGCWAGTPPEGELMDREYIAAEARRLSEVAEGKATSTFTYPSISAVRWPKRRGDAVASLGNGRWAVLGLGFGNLLEGTDASSDGSRRLLRMDFGQTLLVSQPSNTATLEDSQLAKGYVGTAIRSSTSPQPMPDLFSSQPTGRREPTRDSRTRDIHQQTDEVIRGGFDEAAIGRLILACAENSEGEDPILKAASVASIIVKAILARRTKSRDTATTKGNQSGQKGRV